MFRSTDGDIEVGSQEVLGRIHYFDTEVVIARKKLGQEFERRVPPHREMSRIEPAGCVLDTLLVRAEGGSPWWEILILSALQYAKSEVLCVVPDGFRPSSSVLAVSRKENKNLLFTQIRQFSRAERDKMKKT
jgi:hypothetical protein